VQVNGQIVSGALPTKQFLAFLSGVPNPALVNSQTVVPLTNTVYTNLTVEATGFWLLPAGDLSPAELPRSYAVTTNYVVTPDAGLTFYTNNINFTNDVVVTRTTDTNVTYTFRNSVTVPTDRTAYLFPELPASDLTAVWTNRGPGTAFVLSGYVITNVPGTTTNYTYANNPDFTKVAGAKLLYITPVVDKINLPSQYVVRYRNGRSDVDTDVSTFLSESPNSPYQALYDTSAVGGNTFLCALSQIDFDNQAGTSFDFVGFDTQLWGPLIYKGSVLSSSVLKQRKMTAGSFSGYITGTVQSRTFSRSPAMIKGTISISGGKIE
jgi:hypothetical protein